MNQQKSLYTVAVIATVISFVFFMLTATEYIVARNNVAIAQVLTPNSEVFPTKNNYLNDDNENLLRMLNIQRDEAIALHGALSRIARDQLLGAAQQCVAWFVLSTVLSWLTFKLKPLRNRDRDIS